ncbi:MAG TPA: hypothetical protein VKT28_09785 [Puia sp.]|nr:hypothetical protein [Puia sp.]
MHEKPTRFAFVLWSGIGSIGPDFRSAMFQKVIPDFGIGLRFEIQPKMNVRADFGYAPSSTGAHTATYFNFPEAFLR